LSRELLYDYMLYSMIFILTKNKVVSFYLTDDDIRCRNMY